MILKAHLISKSFHSHEKVVLFKDLSFQIKKGQAIAITGKSGVGKTTLLHILGGLEKPDSGEIYIQDTIMTPSNSAFLRQTHLGFVFQAANLLEDFTALENVLMPSKIARKPQNINYGLHLLDQVGLLQRAHFSSKLLSGGEKQRVAIARALCNNPSLILADEPSGNLDQTNASLLKDLLFSLVKKQNKSLILVTHDMDLAASCDESYCLSNGSLISHKHATI